MYLTSLGTPEISISMYFTMGSIYPQAESSLIVLVMATENCSLSFDSKHVLSGKLRDRVGGILSICLLIKADMCFLTSFPFLISEVLL